MDNLVDRSSSPQIPDPLMKWVDEMRSVIQGITDLSADNVRYRSVAEAAQREYATLCDEVETLRTEVERAGGLAQAAQQELDALREEVAALRAENEHIRVERAEAGEAAAKLLGEMRALVNEVAHKFQGPPRPSPFAREVRAPNT
jgi:chromosome segregation ATPase